MKKMLFALLMIGIIISVFSIGLAKDYYPGDTVEIIYELDNTGKATGVDFLVTYDSNVFEGNKQRIQKFDIDDIPLASGTIGTLELTIKDNAPEGNYSIGYSNLEASDTYGDVNVSIKVIPNSITIVKVSPTTPPPADNPTTPPPADDIITPPPADDPTPTTPPPAEDPTCTHTNKTWKVTKPATCTAEGESQYVCDRCGEVLETKAVPALGHDEGEWVVVEKPTSTKEGLKQLRCTRCHEVLKEESIDPVTTEWRFNQSVCSLGIRFRDIKPELTRKWYMFTPVDLSKNGTQNIDLIAANITYIGNVTIEVSGDTVTVRHHVSWPAEKRDMAFTLLHDLDSVNSVDIQNLPAYSFDQPISISKDLNGDTSVLLYVLGHVNYDFKDASNALFVPNDANYQKLATELRDLMD